MLAVGIVIGACVAALSGGEFHAAAIPSLREPHFGNSLVLRMPSALAGGVIRTFGAFGARGTSRGRVHQWPWHRRRQWIAIRALSRCVIEAHWLEDDRCCHDAASGRAAGPNKVAGDDRIVCSRGHEVQVSAINTSGATCGLSATSFAKSPK